MILDDRYADMVAGKNVIVVGPGSTVAEDCNGVDVDSYDVVCRLNYHWKICDDMKSVLGQRIDVIYHCLNADQYTVADLVLWKKKGVPVISQHDMTHYTNHSKTKIYNERNNGVGFQMMYVPYSLFVDFQKRFASNPNTGTLAIIHLLSLPVKSVTVVGFDFYTSLYWFNGDKNLLSAIQRMPHKPKIQFKHFKEYIQDYKNFIPVGRLKALLNQ